jgi:hypothetical protein
MEQRHAIFLTASQEANSLQINQHEFVQIEGYRRSALVDQHFQTLEMLRLHFRPMSPEDPDPLVEKVLNSKSPIAQLIAFEVEKIHRAHRDESLTTVNLTIKFLRPV